MNKVVWNRLGSATANFYLPNGMLLCLGNAQTIETVHEGQ